MPPSVLRLSLACLLATVSIGGCGGNGPVRESTIDATCETTCEAFDECGLLQGFSVEGCIEQCGSRSAIPEDCDATDREARDCLDAWEASTCEELEAGDTPPECDLCPAPTPATQPQPQPQPSGDGCDELAQCCSQIQDPDTQEGCEALAAGGNDGLCAQTLTGFEFAGECTVP